METTVEKEKFKWVDQPQEKNGGDNTRVWGLSEACTNLAAVEEHRKHTAG